MKVNYTGCAICDSTWGDLWETVDDERLFFCCEICLRQFRRLVERTKSETGWDRIDSVEVAGDRHGRRCVLRNGGKTLRVSVAFNAEGEIRSYTSLWDTPP